MTHCEYANLIENILNLIQGIPYTLDPYSNHTLVIQAIRQYEQENQIFTFDKLFDEVLEKAESTK